MARVAKKTKKKKDNKPKKNGLTPLRQRFVDEYLVDLNGGKAAIRAGYSPKSAISKAWNLLADPFVQEALQKRRDALQKKTQVDQEWVISRYKKLADYDPKDLYDDKGAPLPISEIPDDTRYAIQGVDVISLGKKGTVQKVKMAEKKAALDSLGKHLGIFEKDNRQKGEYKIKVTLKNGSE